MRFQKVSKFIVNQITRQHQWIAPITLTALKIYQNTLGKISNFNIDLQLKNNRPFVQINPLFETFDTINLLTMPLALIFLTTLYLLLISTDPLSGTEIVQAVMLICAVTMFIFGGITRHIIRKNIELAAQCNALWQCNPTSKSEDTTKIGSNDECCDWLE